MEVDLRGLSHQRALPPLPRVPSEVAMSTRCSTVLCMCSELSMCQGLHRAPGSPGGRVHGTQSEPQQSSKAHCKAESCYFQSLHGLPLPLCYFIELSQHSLRKARPGSPFEDREAELRRKDRRNRDASEHRWGPARSELPAHGGARPRG